MARNDPIDDYLTDLRRRVATWHRRPDDLVAEAADHLSERRDALVTDGLGTERAAAAAISGYGSPQQIADAHLRTAHRPSIPTAETRRAGTFAMVGGLTWIALAVLVVVLPSHLTPIFMVLGQVFYLAVAMSILGLAGLWMRHGGLGPLSYAAAVPALLAAPFVLFVWPIPAWMILLGLATLLFGIPVIVRRLAPLPSALALTSGLSIAGAAALGPELFVDRTGDDLAFVESMPAMVVMLAGTVVFGLGLIGVGRWMRSEQPVEIPSLPAPTNSTSRPAPT
jgi:hypothetical protein